MECTPAVFIIHIFPMCHVLAFFCDWCCRVSESSCYLSLNQECGGGYLRTKYCRTSSHIFEFVERSWAVAKWLGSGEYTGSRTQPANATRGLMPCCPFYHVYKNWGWELHLLLFDFALEAFGHKCYLSDKANCGSEPCLILLDTTAAVNNALPWITSASWKLINLATTQTWKRISP